MTLPEGEHGEAMQDSDKVIVKATAFSAVLVILAAVFRVWFQEPVAWGLSAFVGVLLFHWLPPRIHHNLTVIKSVGLSLASGIAAGVAVLLVDMLFHSLP